MAFLATTGLVNWTRTPQREPIIPVGPAGAWDSGMVVTAAGPVWIDGMQLCFYYGGFDAVHDMPISETEAAIGLATLRLDGFCSYHGGDQEGHLITRREAFTVPRVRINARTADGGYVVAELLDRNNEVIPEFSREECVAFRGDEISHWLTWQTDRFPEEYMGADKKIRFIIKNGDLYSYLPDGLSE
ncbi:MAG: hypothetical protein R6V19_09820 [Armatimonadota bacterium]